MTNNTFEPYLCSGEYTNSDHPAVIQYTLNLINGIEDITLQIIKIFDTVRDNFRYYPYHLILKPEALKASHILEKDYGYCVEKSVLFSACMRVIGIPSRLCFANVRNHLATEKVENYLRTDLMVFHGYVEIYHNEKWIKVTPVFDKGLCDKFGVSVLDFDGFNDCIFQESDKMGKPFMHYEHYYGSFSDLPFDIFVSELRKYYPHLFTKRIFSEKIIIDF
jgi:transglutaminase-like putative cysteine protease